MMRLEEFHWGTRAEVCEQLLQFVLQAPSTSPTEHDGPLTEPDPGRAEWLLLTLADASCVDVIRQLPEAGREGALSKKLYLLGMQQAITLEDLREVARDAALSEDEQAGDVLAQLLSQLHSPEAQRIARQFLEELSPAERAEILVSAAYAPPTELLAPELEDWLYSRWLQQDRILLDGGADEVSPLNLIVSRATRRRPESRAFLVEQWPRLPENQRAELIRRLTRDLDPTEAHWRRVDQAYREETFAQAEADEALLGDCLVLEPDRVQQMTQALALPLSLLLRHLGADELFLMIEGRIRSASRVLQADRSAYSTAYTSEVRRAIELLDLWPGESVDLRIRSLYHCPDLNDQLRFDLRHVIWSRLWKRDRPQALLAAQAAAQQGNGHWAELAAIGMERHPEPGDRDFLLWAAHQSSVQLRYTAVQALESLGEDSVEWRERLASLSSDEHPAVRLHAIAALVKRGDAGRLTEIVRNATEAENVRARAEALRLLGELDAGQHEPVLCGALLTDHEAFNGHYLPAAEEAALALARLSTPGALTALVQTALVGPHILWASIACYLEVIDPLCQPEPRLSMYPYGNWRQDRYWRD